MSLNPLSRKSANMSVPAAFRLWSAVVSQVGVGCLQVGPIYASEITPEEKETALLEVYSRAFYETLFAMHFDNDDTHVDEHVANQIRELFGEGVLLNVLKRFTDLGGRAILR